MARTPAKPGPRQGPGGLRGSAPRVRRERRHGRPESPPVASRARIEPSRRLSPATSFPNPLSGFFPRFFPPSRLRRLPPAPASGVSLPAPLASSEFPAPLASSEFPEALASSEFPEALASSEFPEALASSEFPAPLASSEFPAPLASSEFPAP
ncbi:MAG: hypothetical protein LBQ12_01455, partial [Deltaproteobacteria bacterium]|nr:hypothetical protein [Deltaproteobacteria bacterium]